jgi:anthranilate synthase component 1
MILSSYPSQDKFVEMAQKGNCIPVCMEVLADTITPVSVLLLHAQKGKPLFLLESVEGGERWGRYSFLGGSARCQVKVFADEVCVEEGGQTRKIAHNGRPLEILRQVMRPYRPVTLPQLPRFWGGMVGYLTYEMVSFFERIAHKLPPDKPLAHFIVTDELYIFDNVRHTLTLLAHVFLEKGVDPKQAYADARKRLEKMLKTLSGPVPVEDASRQKPGRLVPKDDEAIYKKNVGRIKEYIKAGDVIQTVISQSFVCEPSPDPASLYRAMRFVNPSPYMFYLETGDGALVGSSPETMVRLENRMATLRPIAGTRRRGQTQQEDRALADELLADPKEKAEHLMLVDLGRNDLGRVAITGTVQVTDLMFVERYSHVMHLVSNIACDLDSAYDGWDLLAATFPAGTLSGAPKVRAMEIIAELEDSPRGPYGGAVGYFSFTGNMDFAITIRTASIENNICTVRAGAGIVADSDPESENAESINKAGAIHRAIELVS